MTTPLIQPPRRRINRAAAVLLALIIPPLLPGQAGPGLPDLLKGVEARLKAGFTYRGWTADSTTVITELDKNGRPEKITRVTKIVRVADGVRAEEILKAIVTEDGRDSDITRAYAEEQRTRQEKERKRREEAAREGKAKEGRRSGSFDLDEILPFASDKRPGFEFALRPAGGSPYILLEARAKVPDGKLWNGIYTIDPVRYGILRAEVRPSKNPRYVKELWAEADIETLPDGRLFIKRTKFKVDGGIIIKHIRMLVEDSYANARIMDAP
ncbi:MAG: hypothetical protein PHI34_01665 [Acidobacteriota bacterium]|nr:hypothetical protein [Acidobacteriota bacterium]